MKKVSVFILIVLVFVLICTLFACNKESSIEQDTSPLTINVPLNTREYFLNIKELVKEDLGIELELIFEYPLETSGYYNQKADNGNLTDIIFSPLQPSQETQEKYFLDLSDSEIASLFSSNQLSRYSINKHVYRLPLSSTLIGVTYNKTLFEEEDWELPSSLQDLQELANIVSAAGYEFSSSNDAATGFGWNYLFNFAGSEYLNTIEGNKWLKDFLNGKETSANNLLPAVQYLTSLRDTGMFGTSTSTWDSSYTTQHRCAFYVGILGGSQFFNGYRLNEDNEVIGATYFPALIKQDGTYTTEFTMIEDPNGDYVYVDSKYIPYEEKYESLTKYNPSIQGKVTYLYEIEEDENGPLVWIKSGENSNYNYYSDSNSKHQGLTRYKVKGNDVEYITDEYAIMPFISSNGSNNCFVTYDNNIFGLNKNLGNENQKERLDQAEKVLKYIATNEEALKLSTSSSTSFIATKDFDIEKDKMYYDYKDSIEDGYLMDWYYSYFDGTVIMAVGEMVNNYIKKTPMDINGEIRLVTEQDIISTLEKTQSDAINNQVPKYGEMGETLSIKETAELLAKASAKELQKELSDNEIIEVAMIPYAKSLVLTDINDAAKDIIRIEAQKGIITSSTIRCYYPGSLDDIVAVKLTGAQIKKMQNEGYDPYPLNQTNTIEPWLVVTKGNISLEDNKTYIVAIPYDIIDSTYEVIKDNHNSVITITFQDALISLCEELGTIFLKDVTF